MNVHFPEPAQHAVIHTAYVTTQAAPTVLQQGEPVRVEYADSDYQHWFWCSTDDGRSCHVPATYLDVQYPDWDPRRPEADYVGPSKDELLRQVREDERDHVMALLRADFHNRELSVAPKDIVQIGASEGGWYYVRRQPDGTEGWVPASSIDLAPLPEHDRTGQGRHENDRR